MRFTHGDRRLSGLVLPLSAVRTAASPGVGEFPDLALVGELAGAWGLELLQLLPVNDTGTQTSPYGAVSAFALHPLYLRLSELPELRKFKNEAAALVARFGASASVLHEDILDAKLALLAKAWAAAGAALDAELDPWIRDHPWVRPYAAFVELKRRNGGRPWWEWDSHRDPGPGGIEALWADPSLARDLRFWAWVQMRAAGQFRAAADGLASRGVELMGDIPILMNRDSADVWARREAFDLDLVAGAPPDMYAELGQNWGFPIYDWEALEAGDYAFWVERLREADRYYSAYRIDHVLGFFRIWSLGRREADGYLGRFVPDLPISRAELEDLGFDPGRIRWLSRPHVRGDRLEAACGPEGAALARERLLDRIGDEDLFLFKPSIEGVLDIEEALGAGAAGPKSSASISASTRTFLAAAWRDRALFEFREGLFAPAWSYGSASSWPTLSDAERERLESLIARKRRASEELWAATGRKLLGVLKAATPMLPCAEDLGAVPACVPVALEELGILGLRVLRWTREWDLPGQPYVPTSEYPRLSVATPSVHDSSSLREWWEREADRPATWAFLEGCLGRSLGPCPGSLSPGAAGIVLEAVARSASRFAAFAIQDLIALSPGKRPADPRSERINVPGTVDAGNWRYRMPVGVEELLSDAPLAAIVRTAAAREAGERRRGR